LRPFQKWLHESFPDARIEGSTVCFESDSFIYDCIVCGGTFQSSADLGEDFDLDNLVCDECYGHAPNSTAVA
jgi:hypothetical protein